MNVKQIKSRLAQLEREGRGDAALAHSLRGLLGGASVTAYAFQSGIGYEFSSSV